MNTKIVMPPRKGWFDPCGEWVCDGYDAEWNAALDEVLRLNATPPQPAEVGELYPHGHELHKEVFMARDSYCGGESFEDGVRGLIAELKEARAALSKLEGKA